MTTDDTQSRVFDHASVVKAACFILLYQAHFTLGQSEGIVTAEAHQA